MLLIQISEVWKHCSGIIYITGGIVDAAVDVKLSNISFNLEVGV
jgi:hypothetical protein